MKYSIQEFYKLNDGNWMPKIGFGTFRVLKSETKETIKNAVRCGYRSIDCAMMYLNEGEIGEALKELFEEGVVKREELFITSKLWNCYHRKEHVEEALDKTLFDLGLQYLDMYLIHFPLSFHYLPFDKNMKGFSEEYDPTLNRYNLKEFNGSKIDPVPYQETYKAMEDLVGTGKVRSIGVSNCNVAIIYDILSYCRIKPALVQNECHIYLQQPRLRKYLKNNDILMQCYACLGCSGGYAVPGPKLLKDETLVSIANTLGRTPAQVALKFLLDKDLSVLSMSTNKDRMLKNLDLDFTLSDEIHSQLKKLDRNYRFNRTEDLLGVFVPIFD